MDKDTIYATIKTLYTKVFDQGQADLPSDLVAGEYIQHNPPFPNGTAFLAGYLKQAGSLPCEVKRLAIDGDLAFIHIRYLSWGGKEHAEWTFSASTPTRELWSTGTFLSWSRQN